MANPQAEQTHSNQEYKNCDPSSYRDIYYLSRDGIVSWGSTKPGEGEREEYPERFSPPTRTLDLVTKEYGEATTSTASDSRLTLIYLDVFFKVKPLETKASKIKSCPAQYPGRADIMDGYPSIPTRYRNELEGKDMDLKDKFCCHCAMTGDIMWRNIIEAQSRYESRFRTWKSASGVCFLQFHTMQVPYLTSWNVILALVHHIYIPRKRSDEDAPHVESRSEKIFGFVLGLNKENIDRLWEMVKRYHEHEIIDTNIGVTPKMFIAAFLKLYGFLAAKEYIRNSFATLSWVDETLITAERELSDKDLCDKERQKKLTDLIKTCNNLNQNLMEINQNLTGVRSRVHYIGLCARGLMREESAMVAYIRDECSRGILAHLQRTESAPLPGGSREFGDEISQPIQRAETDPPPTKSDWIIQGVGPLCVEDHLLLEKALSNLDSARYARRDHDKLDMISRAMTQYEVDIKSLKAHATMAVGLVSNLYAHSQGHFQVVILNATEKDSKNMRIIATLTILVLPATFWAILVAMPIVEWDPSDSQFWNWDFKWPVIRGAPFIGYVFLAIASTALLGIYVRSKASEKCSGSEVNRTRSSPEASSIVGRIPNADTGVQSPPLSSPEPKATAVVSSIDSGSQNGAEAANPANVADVGRPNSVNPRNTYQDPGYMC